MLWDQEDLSVKLVPWRGNRTSPYLKTSRWVGERGKLALLQTVLLHTFVALPEIVWYWATSVAAVTEQYFGAFCHCWQEWELLVWGSWMLCGGVVPKHHRAPVTSTWVCQWQMVWEVVLLLEPLWKSGKRSIETSLDSWIMLRRGNLISGYLVEVGEIPSQALFQMKSVRVCP